MSHFVTSTHALAVYVGNTSFTSYVHVTVVSFPALSVIFTSTVFQAPTVLKSGVPTNTTAVSSPTNPSTKSFGSGVSHFVTSTHALAVYVGVGGKTSNFSNIFWIVFGHARPSVSFHVNQLSSWKFLIAVFVLGQYFQSICPKPYLGFHRDSNAICIAMVHAVVLPQNNAKNSFQDFKSVVDHSLYAILVK